MRVNRATDELEPWLAEGWTAAPRRRDLHAHAPQRHQFSDGQPLDARPTCCSRSASRTTPAVDSTLGAGAADRRQAARGRRARRRTVTVRLPEPFAPGLRLLDNLPILPKHKLEAALDARARSPRRGRRRSRSTDIVGLGPFVLAEHVAGQRLVFARNPHYFRRDASGVQLPYLDQLTLAIVPDQNTEALRLEAARDRSDVERRHPAAGPRGVPAAGGAGPAQDDGGRRRPRSGLPGVQPAAGAASGRRRAVARTQGIPSGDLVRRRSAGDRQHGVPRRGGADLRSGHAGQQALVRGRRAGVHGDRAKAKHAARRRRPDAIATATACSRTPPAAAARFSILTQAGHLRERVVVGPAGAAATARHRRRHRAARSAGAVRALAAGRLRRDLLRPAGELDGSGAESGLLVQLGPDHFWNPEQKTPATPWEGEVDSLMRQQATARGSRRRASARSPRCSGSSRDELPLIYFVGAQGHAGDDAEGARRDAGAADPAAAVERGDPGGAPGIRRRGNAGRRSSRKLRRAPRAAAIPRVAGSCSRSCSSSSSSSASLLLVDAAPGDHFSASTSIPRPPPPSAIASASIGRSSSATAPGSLRAARLDSRRVDEVPPAGGAARRRAGAERPLSSAPRRCCWRRRSACRRASSPAAAVGPDRGGARRLARARLGAVARDVVRAAARGVAHGLAARRRILRSTPLRRWPATLRYLVLPAIALALPIAASLERLQSQAIADALVGAVGPRRAAPAAARAAASSGVTRSGCR